MTVSRGLHRVATILTIGLAVVAFSTTSRARDLLIVGNDYAFVVPATVRPGLTAISFANHGKQLHEMQLIRLKPGVTYDSVFRVAPGPSRRALMEFSPGAILFAESGGRSGVRLLVNFEAGRNYLLRCTLQDAPDKPEHMALGMYAGFKVR